MFFDHRLTSLLSPAARQPCHLANTSGLLNGRRAKSNNPECGKRKDDQTMTHRSPSGRIVAENKRAVIVSITALCLRLIARRPRLARDRLLADLCVRGKGAYAKNRRTWLKEHVVRRQHASRHLLGNDDDVARQHWLDGAYLQGRFLESL